MGHLGWGFFEEWLQLVHQLTEKWHLEILIFFPLIMFFKQEHDNEACISRPIK